MLTASVHSVAAHIVQMRCVIDSDNAGVFMNAGISKSRTVHMAPRYEHFCPLY
jgi:hypothetical protein